MTGLCFGVFGTESFNPTYKNPFRFSKWEGFVTPILADSIAHLFPRMDSRNRKLNGSVLDEEFC